MVNLFSDDRATIIRETVMAAMYALGGIGAIEIADLKDYSKGESHGQESRSSEA